MRNLSPSGKGNSRLNKIVQRASYEKIGRYNNSPPYVTARWPPQQIPPLNFLCVVSSWQCYKCAISIQLNSIHLFFTIKGVLHPWAVFLKTLCIFSKNKATSDKVSHGSVQKCSKELKNHSFTSVETIVVKLQ